MLELKKKVLVDIPLPVDFLRTIPSLPIAKLEALEIRPELLPGIPQGWFFQAVEITPEELRLVLAADPPGRIRTGIGTGWSTAGPGGPPFEGSGSYNPFTGGASARGTIRF